MSLLSIIIALVLVGVLLWAINEYLPIQPGIKKLLNIIVVVVLAIWLLNALGVWGYLTRIHV